MSSVLETVPPLFRSGIVPSLHLARMLATERPVICLAGDSKGGQSCDSLVPEDSVWGAIRRRFQEDNPGKTFRFHNRAVSTQGWNTFNGTATALWPAWYADRSLPWLPHVQAVQPDVLLLALGINDHAGLAATEIARVLAKIAGWGISPPMVEREAAYERNAILLDPTGRLAIVSTPGTTAATPPEYSIVPNECTQDGTATLTLLGATAHEAKVPDIVLLVNENMNPSSEHTAAAKYQLGTLAAASFVRGTATTNALGFVADGGRIAGLPPLGLIDIGRHFTMAVAGAFPYGFDPLDRYFDRYDGPLPTAALPGDALPPTTAPDFHVVLSVTHGSAFELEHVFGLTTSSPGAAHPTAISLRTDGSGVLVAVTNATSFSQHRYTPGIWKDVNRIEIGKHRTRIWMRINDEDVMDTFSQFFDRPDFEPTFTGSFPEGATIAVTTYDVSRYGRRYAPLLTAAQCWGNGIDALDGNGINHNASQGTNRAVLPVLEMTRFGR